MRTVDGRTLMVLSTWCALLVSTDADGVEMATTPEERREIRSALQNVKYAMEHVHFQAVDE